MQIAIVEDEAKVAQRIERLAKEILGDAVSAIRHCPSLASAIDTIDSKPLDLLFLDLNLNGDDGFDLLARSVSRSFQTIIISANFDKAIRAYEYGVLDFVAKPFTKERLALALERLEGNRRPSDPIARHLAFRIHQRIVLKPLAEVLFIKGADSYSEITFKDGTTYLHDKSLSQLERILPASFERIHKSYIAHLSEARELIVEPNHKYSLRIDSDTTIPVGRSRYHELKSRWL